MKIDLLISELINYGLSHGMLLERDKSYSINRLLELLGIFEYSETQAENSELRITGTLNTDMDENKTDAANNEPGRSQDDIKREQERPISDIQRILDGFIEYAAEKNLIKGDTAASRDIFDTKVIDCIMMMPSMIENIFWERYERSPQAATDYYYALALDSNYIRRDRIGRDIRYKAATKYGELDITINLSKPEKDPKDIVKSHKLEPSSYPKCLLCRENEGYPGRSDHPSRDNHRLIEMNLSNEKWFFQYSPYVYYNEHCIVLSEAHRPMKISKDTFDRLLDFTEIFPHYFIGSNADIPIVGGSILSHDHFQGGNHTFAMAKADIRKSFDLIQFPGTEFGILNWPMSVIRISSECKAEVSEAADFIFRKWQSYDDSDADILSFTENELHNTVNPIARRKGKRFEMDIVLRNNRTTEEYPFGIFHPDKSLHHIKKENIGLIEVLGLAILPGRLKAQLENIARMLSLSEKPETIKQDSELFVHKEWYEELYQKYSGNDIEFLIKTIRLEVADKFLKVLEAAGVFKDTEQGREAFDGFISYLNKLKN